MPSYALNYTTLPQSVDSIDIKARLEYERTRQRMLKGSDIRKKLHPGFASKRTGAGVVSWRGGSNKERQALAETRFRKNEGRLAKLSWEVESDDFSETDDDDRGGKENKIRADTPVSLAELLRPEVKKRGLKNRSLQASSRASSTCSLSTLASVFATSTLETMAPYWPSDVVDDDNDDMWEDCEFDAPGFEEWSKEESVDGVAFISSTTSFSVGIMNHEW